MASKYTITSIFLTRFSNLCVQMHIIATALCCLSGVALAIKGKKKHWDFTGLNINFWSAILLPVRKQQLWSEFLPVWGFPWHAVKHNVLGWLKPHRHGSLQNQNSWISSTALVIRTCLSYWALLWQRGQYLTVE